MSNTTKATGNISFPSQATGFIPPPATKIATPATDNALAAEAEPTPETDSLLGLQAAEKDAPAGLEAGKNFIEEICAALKTDGADESNKAVLKVLDAHGIKTPKEDCRKCSILGVCFSTSLLG